MKVKLINRKEEGEFLLYGRLDSNTSPEVEEILMDSIDKFEKIIINMENLEYISSAGLRVLKKLHVTMKKNSRTLVVKNANDMVMEVFEMTGFAGVLNFE